MASREKHIHPNRICKKFQWFSRMMEISIRVMILKGEV